MKHRRIHTFTDTDMPTPITILKSDIIHVIICVGVRHQRVRRVPHRDTPHLIWGASMLTKIGKINTNTQTHNSYPTNIKHLSKKRYHSIVIQRANQKQCLTKPDTNRFLSIDNTQQTREVEKRRICSIIYVG